MSWQTEIKSHHLGYAGYPLLCADIPGQYVSQMSMQNHPELLNSPQVWWFATEQLVRTAEENGAPVAELEWFWCP